MKCEGNFVFKGIEMRDGGEFKNENGQTIKYNPAYKVVLDENVDGKIVTRTFVFPLENKPLFDKLCTLDFYDDVLVSFEVVILRNAVKLVPVDVTNSTGEF